MKSRDCMSPDVRIARRDAPIREAPQMMREADAGSIPVGENDRLVGIISLGDIAKTQDPSKAHAALARAAEPGGPHQQQA